VAEVLLVAAHKELHPQEDQAALDIHGHIQVIPTQAVAVAELIVLLLLVLEALVAVDMAHTLQYQLQTEHQAKVAVAVVQGVIIIIWELVDPA
jgi:surfactin synthase thioesterase subunit